MLNGTLLQLYMEYVDSYYGLLFNPRDEE